MSAFHLFESRRNALFLFWADAKEQLWVRWRSIFGRLPVVVRFAPVDAD
ncbi:hypothetical protein [Pseudomonas sp. R3-18-08]|nr:hypothetical protein [Pseudomonas sp. R3-18-08]AZF15857.1 hypothetical protein C4J92_2373 [Pseudomonas sp. R3-18-08]